MKKRTKQLLMLLLLCFSVSGIFAQEKAQEKKVIITYNWSRILSHGSNQIAIWIEDTAGHHIRTLFATNFTAKGGYLHRPVSLSEWTEKFDIKNATKDEIDAVTGATPPSGKQTVSWDLKDKKANPVPAGTYVVRMEANNFNTDKMHFRGEITIGGDNQLTKGEITFSSTNLATRKILFSDVLVEYK